MSNEFNLNDFVELSFGKKKIMYCVTGLRNLANNHEIEMRSLIAPRKKGEHQFETIMITKLNLPSKTE